MTMSSNAITRVMSYRRFGLALFTTLLICVTPMMSQAEPIETLVERICVPKRLDKYLVLAVLELESQCKPLAINVFHNGRQDGLFPKTIGEARLHLDAALDLTENVGVGLMQVTYKYHRRVMASNPARFFDPVRNLIYGCQYLAEKLEGPDPLFIKIGRYHSKSNIELQEDYAAAVLDKRKVCIETQTCCKGSFRLTQFRKGN